MPIAEAEQFFIALKDVGTPSDLCALSARSARPCGNRPQHRFARPLGEEEITNVQPSPAAGCCKQGGPGKFLGLPAKCFKKRRLGLGFGAGVVLLISSAIGIMRENLKLEGNEVKRA